MRQQSAQAKTEARSFRQLEREPDRQWLLKQLGEVLEIAMARVTNPKTSALDRIRWSRVVIAAGQACNSVLRDVEIEALKKQVEELKALTMAKLGDEQGTDQEGHPEASADA